MTDLLQRVEQNISHRELLRRRQKILVAVSGGLDSMVLLHLLHALQKRWRWGITVAHFNHQLRGRASDADEKLVRQTAARLKLPMVAGRADVKSFAAQSKLSVEMAARKLRHEFLARTARAGTISGVALAHHADDQVELFFLRLMRGAGGDGLAGMKWRSPSPADAKLTLVRPLLNFAKAELRQFARENGIQFREDATNFSTDLLRNRIRNELLPLLRKKYQPSLNETILRAMEILGAEAELVGEVARASRPCVSETNGRDARATNFKNLPVAVQRRVLQSQLLKLGVAADFDLIESLRRTPDVLISIGPGLFAARDGRGEVKLQTAAKPEFNSDELPVDLSGRKSEVVFGGKKFVWQIRKHEPAESPRRKAAGGLPARREFFDADRVGGRIILRHWRAGDRFQPIGLKSAAKLQDLFVNAKIPRERRRHLVVAEAAAGEIFWVEGLRIGEPFKLTPETTRRLAWRWRNPGI